MPILTIKALPQNDHLRINRALKHTTSAIAKIYDCDEKQVSAIWQEINPGLYIEGQCSPQTQPEESHPPIAELLCFEGKTDQEIEVLLEVAASTLSEQLELKDNIFMTYKEAKSGRVIADNGIVRKS